MTNILHRYKWMVLPKIIVCALLLCIFMTTLVAASSKKKSDFFLKDGMTWVILGDSITAANLHVNYLEAYCHLRFPKSQFHIRGAGRGGSQIPESLQRFESDVGIWEPNVVSVELGTNGGDKIDKFTADLETLCTTIKDIKAVPILFSFNPAYNDNALNHPKMQRGDAHIQVAKKNKLTYVDQYRDVFTFWDRNFKSKNPLNLYPHSRNGKLDLIHPAHAGHLIKTYVLLKGLQAPTMVSTASIDAAKSKLIDSEHCLIKKLKAKKDRVSFTRLDERLPLAFDDEARPALQLAPEILDMSQYILQIKGLSSGTYVVEVDGEVSGEVDSKQLKKGWNMTNMTAGPIHQQCQEILRLIRVKEGANKEKASVGNYRFFARLQLQRKNIKGQALKDLMKEKVESILAHDTAIHQAAQPQTRTFVIRKKD